MSGTAIKKEYRIIDGIAVQVTGLAMGDIVECPKCKASIMKCIEAPTMGMPDYDKCFEKIQDIKLGDMCNCKECGAMWAIAPMQGIHVRGKGWII